MKATKKSAKERLYGAVAKGSETAPIKNEAWNFAPCPHPEQTEACYLYEYSLECEELKAEVAIVRGKNALREASKERDHEWLRQNPAPSNEAEIPAWAERAKKEIPNAIVYSSLSGNLNFLYWYPYFPSKHWLETPAEERGNIGKKFYPKGAGWGHSAFHMEARSMTIQTVEDLLNTPSWGLSKLLPVKVPGTQWRFRFFLVLAA